MVAAIRSEISISIYVKEISAEASGARGSQNQSVGIDPLVFQNEHENKVEWAAAPLEKWDTYTEEKQLTAHGAWLRQAATLAGKDSLPSIDVMADELERGIWANWMPGLKCSRMLMTKNYAGKVDEYESVDSAIEDRFAKPGILKMADTEIHWYQRAETEDKKLIAWAQGYKIKHFLSLK